jgi:hypothetical protein
MLTLKELAKKLDVVPDTIRNYTKMGLPFQYDEKGRYRFDEEEAIKWYFRFKEGGVVNGKKVNGNGIVKLPSYIWGVYGLLKSYNESLEDGQAFKRGMSQDAIKDITGFSRREMTNIRYSLNTSPFNLYPLISNKNGYFLARNDKEVLDYIKAKERAISSMAKEVANLKRRLRLNGQTKLAFSPYEEEVVHTIEYHDEFNDILDSMSEEEAQEALAVVGIE